MSNYQFPYPPAPTPTQSTFSQFQQIQQMFPQPQGSVYSINTPTEIGNVPIGSTGLSVAICFPEQLMYIKSFQNGNPVIMAYRVSPYSRESEIPEQAAEVKKDSTEERLGKIEQQLTAIINSAGGKFDGLL